MSGISEYERLEQLEELSQRTAVDLVNYLQINISNKDYNELSSLLNVTKDIASKIKFIEAEQLYQQDMNEKFYALNKFEVRLTVFDNTIIDEESVGSLFFIGQTKNHGKAKSTREMLSEARNYLYSCSSYHQVFTKKYLNDIETMLIGFKGDCNTGSSYSSHKGWWSCFHLWLVESRIANLLYVGQLEEDAFVVDYNTKRNWVAVTPDGTRIVFKRDTGRCKRFPYIEMGSQEALTLVQAVPKVETVRGNFEGFTKREIQGAILARKGQASIASPSQQEFHKMVSRNCTAMRSAPMTCANLINARTIFGPDLSGLRGKSTREKPERVDTSETVVPRYFYGLHKYVTLTADVMFVNGVPFLLTLSRKIRLFTSEYLPSQTAAQLSSSLDKVVKLYARGGFSIRVILMDMEFDKVVEKCPW